MRQSTPLVLGGKGVIRGTGIQVTEPASLFDLRNVVLRPGRALRRGGLARVATIEEADAVIGLHPIRSQGVSAVLTYNTTTRVVKLHRVAGDGTVASGAVTVWTLPAGVPSPKVSLTDVYDTLVVAHDEPVYSLRQVTRVYTPSTNTIADLAADLFTPTDPPTPAPIRFRGVTSYLSYLVGWGYGTENTGDQDRPEIVRVSLPDDPTQFEPEHYFIAGQRGDPVLGCYEAGGVLAVRKASISYEIFGYDRTTFGIRPADPYFGVASPHLGVVVGERNYFWSLEGPRVSAGGASQDMALPLDLRGPQVNGAVLDEDEAFACYDPTERSVLFLFGSWGYAWHLEAEAWSYREYRVPLTCGGVLFRDAEVVTGVGPRSAATFVSAAPATVTADSAGGQLVVSANTTGVLLGGELIELWVRSGTAPWALATSQLMPTLGAQTVSTAPTLALGANYEVAVRVVLAGIGQDNALGLDPMLWDAATRGAADIPLPPIATRTVAPVGARFFATTAEPDAARMHFLVTIPPLTRSELRYEVRHRLANGAAWSDPLPAVAADSVFGRVLRLPIVGLANVERDVEMRVSSRQEVGAWVPAGAAAWFGPQAPTGVVVTEEEVVPGVLSYVYDIVASAEPAYPVESGRFTVRRDDGAGYVADATTPLNIPLVFAFAAVNAVGVNAGGAIAYDAAVEAVWRDATYRSQPTQANIVTAPGGGPPPGGGGGVVTTTTVAARAERWAPGTGLTLAALGFPLQPGQLRPANIHRVSVWVGGVEVSVYAEPLGAYGDGSARVLWLQAELVLTNGSPVAAEVRLDGGFTQPRRALVDVSAVYVNTPGNQSTDWLNAGLPQGAIVPSSPAHLCRALYAPGYVPDAEAPIFAGSANTKAWMRTTFNTVARANVYFPQPGADYNGGLAYYAMWAETGDSIYLRTALSQYTKLRTEYYIPGRWMLPEWRNHWDEILQNTLMLRDTLSLSENLARMDGNNDFNGYYLTPNVAVSLNWSLSYFGARGWAKNLMALGFALAAWPDGGDKITNGSSHRFYAEQWLGRSLTAPLWNGTMWTSPDANGQVSPWQNMMMCRAVIQLCDMLPASTLRTNALEACATCLAHIRTTYMGTSSYGRSIFRDFVSLASPAGPYTDDLVDLSGFFAPMFAWRGWYKSSQVDLLLAAELYATCGLPQGTGGGPFIQPGQIKQWSQTFHALQQTLYYLKLAGL
jgi:hypothetical protein